MKIIGLDIGGTGIRASDGTGKISRPTRAGSGPERLLSDIKEMVRDLCSPDTSPLLLSIGMPGLISEYGEILGEAANIPGLKGFALKKKLADFFGCTVHIANDVNLGAFAEYSRRTVQKPLSGPFIFLSIGTGLGGGIILDGKMLTGSNGFAAEAGHIVSAPGGRKCSCGLSGCVEQYVSSKGIIRGLSEYAPHIKSLFSEKIRSGEEMPDPVTMYRYLAAGDALAKKVHKEFCRHLAWLCGTLCGLFNPGHIVLGGGIMNAGKHILEDTLPMIQNYTLPGSYDSLTLEHALLGDDACLTGAWEYGRILSY